MTIIRLQYLTPSQAHKLVKLGFVLTLKEFHRIADLYEVMVRS